MPARFGKALLDGKVDIAFSEGLEDDVGGAHVGGCNDLFQLGRACNHDDRKRWLSGVGLCEQAEGVLIVFVFDSIPIHEEQVGGRRFGQTAVELGRIGKHAHLKAVREDAANVIQNRRIAVEDDDVRAAFTLRFHGCSL